MLPGISTGSPYFFRPQYIGSGLGKPSSSALFKTMPAPQPSCLAISVPRWSQSISRNSGFAGHWTLDFRCLRDGAATCPGPAGHGVLLAPPGATAAFFSTEPGSLAGGVAGCGAAPPDPAVVGMPGVGVSSLFPGAAAATGDSGAAAGAGFLAAPVLSTRSRIPFSIASLGLASGESCF